MARSADWGTSVPRLQPMGGCRPLDTYTPWDCPCHGAIPRGSVLYCLVCHKSGFDAPLWAERLRTQAAEHAAWAKAQAEAEAERGKTLADRKARQATEREARRRARRQLPAGDAA